MPSLFSRLSRAASGACLFTQHAISRSISAGRNTPSAIPLTQQATRNTRRIRIIDYCLLITVFLPACAPQAASSPTPEIPTATDMPIAANESEMFLLSMEENGHAHLFLYSLGGQPLLRLTDGDWSDLAPSLSPDGKQVAFASNRSGYWDLYLLTLASGEVTRLTDTPAYDSAPTWSPDGQWLACETYDGEDLEIAVIQLSAPGNPPAFLTDNDAADTSPAWAPQGRKIAFVSNQSGNPEIWLADLDRPGEERFFNLSGTPFAAERNPQWAENRLVWTTEAQGIGIGGAYVWDAGQPDLPARWIADADLAAWKPSGGELALILRGPNTDYLSASSLDKTLILPPQPLPGLVRGLLWLALDLSRPPASYLAASETTPPALWSPAVTPLSEGPNGRWAAVRLPNVQAPYPQLHDQADEAFASLRERVVKETGWDALASLQNAYVPLTAPLEPGLGNDWLYTGRAFALNPLLVNAGWMISVREDIGPQTYWRLYLRAEKQDGSQGAPLNEAPWDLAARYNLDPQAYDQGGAYAPIPKGYWVDFTALARAYGWERLPALPNWRAYFSGTRFTEFALTGGLDWRSAMLELYPPEIMITPTLRLPPTLTPTRTPVPTRTRGPTPTPSNTPTPTFTPSPTYTATPVPSNTPLP